MNHWMKAPAWAATGKIAAVCGLFMLAAVEPACTASVSASPPPPVVVRSTGNVIVDWTINNSKDPAECDATGTATINVSLYNSAGTLEGQWVQDCTAFATTIGGLVPDTYTGQANLLDRAGHPRTTTVDFAPFNVIGGAATTVAIDFPVSSFF